MAVPDCIDIGQANDFLSKDANRISGRIARSLAINSPWINAIETGTFASGVSCVQRSVVQEAIAPALSQCNPQWGAFQCNLPPNTVCYGSTEYQYSPQQYFEKSCPLCLQLAFCAFRNSIRMVEMSYTDHLQTLWNSWIRRQMLDLSATKVVADNTATSFSDIVANGFQTKFPRRTPNSPLTFKFVKFLANYLTHSLLAGDEFKWGTGMMKHFRLITDQQTIDSFRADDSIRQDLRFITSGCCGEKENLLTYSWEGPYQGVAFAVDQSIIRVSGINLATGDVCCVEPFLSAAATLGTKRVINPDWLSARYQISFLMAKGSFTREIPEEYLGEGLTRFERQNWGGRITWHNVLDNCANITGNTGFHYWQLAAAFRPERPEFVIPILHMRCADDMGLISCTPAGYYTQCV